MMKKLSKFGFWKILCSLSLVIGLGINEVWAGIDSYDCYPIDYKDLPKAQSNPSDDQATVSLKQKYFQLKQDLETLCQTADDNHFEVGYTSQKNLEENIQADGKWNEYQSMLKELKETVIQIKKLPFENDCGDLFPYGCPNGEKCWTREVTKTSVSKYGTGMSVGSIDNKKTKTTEWSCSVDSPGTDWKESSKGSQGIGRKEETTEIMGGTIERSSTQTNNDGSTDLHSERTDVLEGVPIIGTTPQSVDAHIDADGNVTWSTDVIDFRSNEACHIDQLKEKYVGTCYSCVVVSAIISTFMAVANLAEPLMQDAGTKLLLIGMMIWIPIYILGKLSSFVSLEPMKMAQELLTFFFKCLLAYTLITSGLKTISTLIVNPLLVAGADYGIAIIDTVMPEKLNIDGVTEDNKSYRIAASNSIDRKVFDRIMTISKKADAAVSLNFVIGNALFCHSYHAGAISFKIPITETTSIPFYFPDFWLMLCGAVIWFFAFMVVMGINFYLLDLSFKIGFALMALPITLGLWPFNKFKSKFVECVKIIINAAGTFMFLGISTGITIVLISSALGGTERLLKEINENNQEYVSQLFSLTGSSFLIILFAFFYSHNLISETVSKLTDKFFSSKMSGLNPMHEKTTQMIDFAKKQIGNAASAISGGVGGMAANATRGVATKAARKVVDGIRGKGSDDK